MTGVAMASKSVSEAGRGGTQGVAMAGKNVSEAGRGGTEGVAMAGKSVSEAGRCGKEGVAMAGNKNVSEAGRGGTEGVDGMGEVLGQVLQAVRSGSASQLTAVLQQHGNKSHLRQQKAAYHRYLTTQLDPSKQKGSKVDDEELMTEPEMSFADNKHPAISSLYTLYSEDLVTAALTLPLQLAAHLGRTQALHLMTNGGFNINENVENLNVCAAHLAAIEGHTDCIMVMIQQGANVELRDKYGRTPLFLAVACGQAEVTTCLIRHGADVDSIATGGLDTGRTALHAAASGGFVEIVQILLNSNAKLNVQDYEGYTPMHIAARDEHPEIVRMLVKAGASMDVQDKGGKTPLHTALPQLVAPTPKQCDIANFLLKTTKLYIGDRNGLTPMHYAAYWDLASLIEDMIKYQNNTNIQDKHGRSPLHYAFTNKHKMCLDAAKVLITNKGNIQLTDRNNKMPLDGLIKHDRSLEPDVVEFISDWMPSHVPEEFGKSLLHLAVLAGNTDIVRFLLQCGVDVDLQDNSGNSPLHLATIGNRTDLIRVLIGKGAMVNMQNYQNLSPLHYAVMLPRTTAATMLLHHGASVPLKDENGFTALHKAAGWGTLEMNKLLVNNGAVVNEFQNKGQRPIHQAAEEGKVEVVDYLIAKGSKVSVQDKDGRTPLHLAAKCGHADVIRALTINGADVNLVDKDGQAPLHVCCFFGKDEAAKALINRGASVSLKDSQGLKPENVALEMGNQTVVQMMREHRKSMVLYAPDQLDAMLADTSSKADTNTVHQTNNFKMENKPNEGTSLLRHSVQASSSEQSHDHHPSNGDTQEPPEGPSINKGPKRTCHCCSVS